ncbi:hypothetical protein RRG08_037064 [Elysia crispata]|uniref:RING-type domain-containing protein n=1 Tax=Elysia crispata TaxID=231223 RepID=A0AAE0ZVQ2_9GAST|nr:hypothetical protein RRG08_037064 [Elysia crispata]
MTGPASARVVLTDTRLLKWQGSQRTLTASQAFSFRETPVPSLVLRGGYGISLPLTKRMAGHAPPKRLRISELNPHLLCALCGGYLIDATTIIECLHSFCKTCILRYLESSNYCPICEVLIHKTRPWQNIRLDHALQNAVYKTVPGLFQNEMKRRREFYQKQNKERRGRVSSGAKDARPSAQGDCCSHGQLGDRVIFSKDEKFSISIEFSPDGRPVEDSQKKNTKRQKNAFPQDKRYLNCPAGLRIEHLKKFIRAKFSLPEDIQIDLFYEKDPLCDTYSLMDVAYICMWKRDCVLRLFYSFYEVPPKIPRLDTAAVKLEMQRVHKDGQKAHGEGSEEKAGHVKAEEEKQEKKQAFTDRKCRSQKEEKHKKQTHTEEENSTPPKTEVEDTREDKDKVKDSLFHSNLKVNCLPTVSLTQMKVTEEMEVKVLLGKAVLQKQEEVTQVKEPPSVKLNLDSKPPTTDKKVGFGKVGLGMKNQDNAASDIKPSVPNNASLQEVKHEIAGSPSSIVKAAPNHAGIKRKYQEPLDAETSRDGESLLSQQASSVGKPIQLSTEPCQKDSKPVPKAIQDIKPTPAKSCSDFKGSVSKYLKPASPSKDAKPTALSQTKKLNVSLTDTKPAPTVQVVKSASASHNGKLAVQSQSIKTVNHANAKSAVASHNVHLVSTSKMVKPVTVALDKKSILTSQIVESHSTPGACNSHASQKIKSSSQKDAKILMPNSKDCKPGSSSKETQFGCSSRETKSNTSCKESKPAVKYTHQAQQTVSYTIVSCGINAENGKFPSGPNSPKAPLKMLIKSSESKDSKTCFVASGPLGISKEPKHKVIYPSSTKVNSKDTKLSPTKTSVGTCTESGSSKQKQSKEKKNKHSESKSGWKPKKTSPKVNSSADRQPVSYKTENKSLLQASAKSTQSGSISKNAQDVYNFVPEEKEDVPQKKKEVLKINTTKSSIIKTPVSAKEVHNASSAQPGFPTAIAAHLQGGNSLEPEQSEAVNLSHKPLVSDKQEGDSLRSSPTNPRANGKIPTPSNHCQTKVAVSSLSHSSMDNSYTYMYAIDLSKAKTAPKVEENSADSKPASGSVELSKMPASEEKRTSQESQQELVNTQREDFQTSGTRKNIQDNLSPNKAGVRTVVHALPSTAHSQIKTPSKSGVQHLKVSNSLAMVVANLASSAVSNLVTSIKLASSKAPSSEAPALDQSFIKTTEPHIFHAKTPVADTKSINISTTCQVPTSSLKPAVTEALPVKSSIDVNCATSCDISSASSCLDESKTEHTSPDSTVSPQALVSSTQKDSPSEAASSAVLPEVSSTKPPVNKPSSPSPAPTTADVPKTIITVPLIPSQTGTLIHGRPNDLKIHTDQLKAQQEKPGQRIEDVPSNQAEVSTTISPVQPESSSLATSISSTPPTVSISSITTSSSPTTVSISLSPNRNPLTATSTAPVSNDTSSTIISISLPGVSSASTVNSASSASVTSASTTFSTTSVVKSIDSITSALAKQNASELKSKVSEDKTFLTSAPRKSSVNKSFDSPGKKLEASVSKLHLPKDPRKIDNFLFDTLPSERESPTSTSSPKPKDMLSSEPEEPQSSSFMEDTIISVARGTLPEVIDSAPLESEEASFAAVHHLPKSISQTSKAHAARKTSAMPSNYSSPLPSNKLNNNVIQTTKISTLIPKSNSTTSKSSLYAKAFPYPPLNTIPASRGFLHAAFPHASIMHPDFTAMVNGTNNFVRSLIAAQHASRPALSRFHSRSHSANYHLPTNVTMPPCGSKPQMSQVSPSVSTATNKSAHQMSNKSQVGPKSQGSFASSKSISASSFPKSTNSQTQATAYSNDSSTSDSHKSMLLPSTKSLNQGQKDKEGKSIKLRAMPPLTIPKSGLGGTTLKLQRSPGSTDHYVLSPTTSGSSSNTQHHNHNQKPSKETKRSNSVGSGGSRTPTSPLSPKDSSLTGERQRVPTIKISDINRNPIIVDSGNGSTSIPTTSTTCTASTSTRKTNCNTNHSHNHRIASTSSSSSRPPSASSTSSLSPSTIPHSNNNTVPSPNSSSTNHRTSSRGGDRGSDSSCSPTGSVPERSPARDCRRPPSAEFLLPHHQRWHGFPTAELLFHGFKLPAHAHFQELHYDTDAMPLDYSQSSSKS